MTIGELREQQQHWHELPTEVVLARLRTTREGLTQEEARRRLAEYGPNEQATDDRARPLLMLLHQVRSPLISILLVAAVVTTLLGKYVDTVVILAVVVLNSVVGFVQEYKAEQALRALARLVAPRAHVLRDGEEHQLETRELVPGDIVILEAGMKVPADLRLLRELHLQTDESILTGESTPVSKTTEPIPDPDAPISDQANMLLLGTTVVRGRGAGVVVATGMETVLGRISAQVRQVGEVESPLQVRLGQFARLIALLVVGVTALILSLGILLGEALADVILTAVATAVATVPEGLPVTITVALAVGVWRMAQRNAIIRKLPAVETLGSCTTICSDKTGTLTRNEMTVTRIVAGGRTYTVTGVGYAPEGEILDDGHRVRLEEHPALALTLRIGLLSNESAVVVEDGRHVAHGDPTEAALIVAALKAGLPEESEREAYPMLDELPFESERQYMATLHEHAGERLIFVKGAPERIVEMCDWVEDFSVATLDRPAVLWRSQQLAAEGLRVLAMAYRRAPADADRLNHDDIAHGLVFVGLQAMIDPPRPEAAPAVTGCKRAGIRVVMITGDHQVTASAIARQIGIVEDANAPVLDGRALERLTDDELFAQVKEVAVYARASPSHKLRIVQQLRRHGEIVAVTGDGVNDAPALKQADIGVAMAIAGTDVAKEAADIVLADDNFATIYAAVEAGRVVFDNIRKVIMFLIPTGLGLVLMIIAAMLLGLPLPFLPAQVIWLNLVTNGLQDVAMAFEPAEEDVGRRPPRDPQEGVLTGPMLFRIGLVGFVLLAGPLLMFIWYHSAGGSLEYARVVAMTTHVLMKTFHIFNSRSLTRSIFQMDPFSNRLLFLSLVGGLGLHVLALYWGPLQFVLATEPLNLDTWLVILLIAGSVVVVVEAEKLLRRRGAS